MTFKPRATPPGRKGVTTSQLPDGEEKDEDAAMTPSIMQNTDIYHFSHRIFKLTMTLEAISSKPLSLQIGRLSFLEMGQFLQDHSSRKEIQTRTPGL